MKTLIIKFGASGDVIRTTTLLHLFDAGVDWITSDLNSILLEDLPRINKIFKESELKLAEFDHYDLIINLEDTYEAAKIIDAIKHNQVFGAYLNKYGKLNYTDSSKDWFDLSLISKYGIEKANKLKFENQKSFQEIIYAGLGFKFNAQPYLLPKTNKSELFGDVAISPKAGKVWPMKNWAYFNRLADHLREQGFIVNFLPNRDTILEHLADIRSHSFSISGDSLPMHFALGSNIDCISLFICTSAAEIFDYGIQQKIISPQLEKYFYRRDFDEDSVKSIPFETVTKVFEQLIEKKISYA